MHPPERTIKTMLANIENHSVYYVNLVAAGEKPCHATGLRRLPGTNILEFYEPNFGFFQFNNDSVFIDFMRVLLSVYYLDNKFPYTALEIFPIARQNSIVKKNDLPGNNTVDLHFLKKHTRILAFGKLLGRFDAVFTEEMEVDIYQKILTDSLLVRIKYTDDVDALERLDRKIRLNPDETKTADKFLKLLNQPRQDTSVITTLWSRVTKNSESDSVSVIRKAIHKRINELPARDPLKHKRI